MVLYIPVIIGTILALVATVLLYILIMPEKNKNRLNGFFRVVRDIFNFKTLFIEKILKILYAFMTLSCILIGFFMLFSWTGGRYYTRWNGWIGLLIMILGPIVIRVIYEFSLLSVFAVARLMSIDNKIPVNPDNKDRTPNQEPAPYPDPADREKPGYAQTPGETSAQDHAEWVTPESQPLDGQTTVLDPVDDQEPVPEPVYRYCAHCGAKYDITKGGCPNGCR